MNRFTNSSDLDGYSKKVRVNYHEVKSEMGRKNTQTALVKFASQHKSHPDIKAILTVSITHKMQTPILKIESLQLLDFKQEISTISNKELQQIIYSVLLATFEYGNNQRIHEWIITASPGFQRDLEKMEVVHNTHSFDDDGRCQIAVRSSEFLSKGKQLINLWTQRFFEGGPVLN